MGSNPGAGCIGPVVAVSRSPSKLDVFTVGSDGFIYTAAWEPGDTAWRGWWQIPGVRAAPCAPISAVSRSKDKLDVFVVGLHGRVHTAAWESGDSAWRGWWTVGDLVTVLHAPVTAVSRSTDKLDIFAADRDGRVCTAAWEPGDEAWRGWWQIAGGVTPPGAPVGAVSRSANKLDAFVVGNHGRVYTAAWEPGDEAWRGWWSIGTLATQPRAHVSAVSRSKDKLDVFVVGSDGGVYTAAWEPADQTWRGWWRIGSATAPPRSPVGVVSRSADKLDVFITRADESIATAAWQPGDTTWRGWWPVAGGTTLPGAPIGAVSRATDKLDVFATSLDDGRVYTAAWEPGDTAWRGWWAIGGLVCGMSDPAVADWYKVGVAFSSENTDHSQKAQGVTTDGAAWFLSSNGSKTIRKYGPGATLLGQIAVPQGKQGGHVGAPGCFGGWIYVPIQWPHGVWKATTDLASEQWLPADTRDNRFSWCDVNPLNGRLYTSMFDISSGQKAILFAYDRDTLARRPEDDIVLGPTSLYLDHIQGGVFTVRGRVILSRSDPNAIFCFSALTGHCFGALHLGNFGSTDSEVEGVTVRAWQFGGTQAQVHVLELDNDWSSKSDSYLHSFHVPDPERL
jgi:hypothetical protein